MSKPETKVQEKIQKALKTKYGTKCYIQNNHGDAFTKRGIPDLQGYVEGISFAFEVKTPDTMDDASLAQKVVRKQMIEAGINVAEIICSFEEALRLIEEFKEKKNDV